MKGLVYKIDALLKLVIVICLSLMAIFVFTNVVLRYAFNSGITWSEEVSRFLFVWLIFLGAILAFKDNEHLGVDSFVKKLPLAGKKVVYTISNIILLITLVFLFDGSWKLTLLNVDLSAPATGMSYAYIYVFGVIMSGAMILIILFKLFRFIFKKDMSQLIMTTGSEEIVELAELENVKDKTEAKKK
ncbi:TRAP transporter small permease [Bacillus sp. FJAT-29790]|uniref:TRAP transporter small permease n=1 Tax=Bacillus sp. FJAT-29790 TaxID=1895002 RepID=UPI001C227DC7|nr:TRAP transporter small permease [Bacillus sp. FJAT-29790]MBU8880714.1 TRAP transporter small permease [Bacillus sp. FJAT-29790]